MRDHLVIYTRSFAALRAADLDWIVVVWSFPCKYKKRVSCSWWFPGYTCPPGESKKTITLGVGESVEFSTQDADSYGQNVKCVVKFKVIFPIYILPILHTSSSYSIQMTSYLSSPLITKRIESLRKQRKPSASWTSRALRSSWTPRTPTAIRH